MSTQTDPSVTNEGGLRVLMCSDHFYPDLSSGGRLLTDLAHGLAVDTQMFVITAFSEYNSSRPVLAHEEYRGITIDRVWSTSFSRKRIWGRLLNEITFCLSASWRVLTGSRPDVIYVLSSPPFLPMFISFVSRLRGVPYLFVMMDVFPDIAVKMGLLEPESAIVRFWNWLSNLSLRRADRIVVLGRCMHEIIQAKLGSDRIPIDVIHNWSDRRSMYPVDRSQNPFFSDHPALNGKFIVLYSGNLGRFQDFETILKSAEAMLDDDHVRFVIAGEGARREWLSQNIESRRLHNVSLLPFVPQDQLIYSLNAADVGLVTLERGAEGLGVPSKFYPLIAVGKPIIALMGDQAEIARLVRETDIGTVVTQGDVDGLVNAIKLFTGDSERHLKTSQRAQTLFLERFDREYAIQAYRTALHLTRKRRRDQ
jgi:glycosyltransferase involved in cell wall biosynthesis